MRRPYVWIALALLLAACGSGSRAAFSRPTSTPVPPPQPIVVPAGGTLSIGVSAPLSGEQVTLGSDIADAVDLAVAEYGGLVRGRTVRVLREDDGCADPERAVDAARALMAEASLAGVIGPMCTTGAQAANILYQRAGIVHIAAAATRDELSETGDDLFFRLAWRDDAQAAVQARFALGAMNARTAVVIDDSDPYGTGLASRFVRHFESGGGRVITRERIRRGDTDFSGLVRQIVSARPDVVLYEGLDPEGALLLRQLREGKYPGSFMGPDALLNVRDFLVPAGLTAENAVVTGSATADTGFVERFQARAQRAPATPFVLQAHDAVTMLLRAMDSVAEEQADGALRIDRARLAEALRAQAFDGLTGSITFNERGERAGESARERGLTVYRVREGRFERVE